MEFDENIASGFITQFVTLFPRNDYYWEKKTQNLRTGSSKKGQWLENGHSGH